MLQQNRISQLLFVRREVVNVVKEIYVFGAGASHASNQTPLGKDLVWNYHQDCCMMSPIINGQPDNREEDARKHNFIKFLKIAGDYYPDLKGELDIFINRGISMYAQPYNMPKKYYIDEMLRELFEKNDFKSISLVRQLIFEHLAETIFSRPRNDLYKKFVNKVLLEKSVEDVAIISFNFDYLLNETLNDHVSFDYFIEFDHISSIHRDDLYKQSKVFPLLKLNGSLDWGICSKCGYLYLYFPHMNYNFYNGEACYDCGGQIHPFIYIPHEKHSQKIEILYDIALGYIREAKKIIVIGYSFPFYDTKVIDLFSKALSSKTQIEIIDLYEGTKREGIAYCNQLTSRVLSLFPACRDIQVRNDGFEGFIDQIENI